MQKTNSKLWVRFVPLLLILVLAIAACNGGDDLTATLQADSTSVEVGDTVTLTASATNATGSLQYAYAIEAPSGSSVTTIPSTTSTATFTPDVEGEYTATVTITDADGNTDEASEDITVGEGDDPGTGGPTGGDETGGPGDPPTGGTDTEVPTQTAFGASDSATGTFTSDADSNIEDDTDNRIVDVTVTDSDAGTFYLQVQATDNEGISGVSIQLRNAPVEENGTLTKGNVALSATDPVAGFTLGSIQDTSTCALDGSETSVTCTYEVSVAAGTPEIESFDTAGSTDDPFEGEFAYVFRATVSDEAGNTTDPGDRGYVDLSQ